MTPTTSSSSLVLLSPWLGSTRENLTKVLATASTGTVTVASYKAGDGGRRGELHLGRIGS